MDPYTPPPGSRGIVSVLETARSHLTRLAPAEAYSYLQKNNNKTLEETASPRPPAVLVDIRPSAQREEHGQITGALIIERNVLEWRFDPRCEARLKIADRYDLRVIVMCQEGYTSSLAAFALRDLGLWNATDVVGGIKAVCICFLYWELTAGTN